MSRRRASFRSFSSSRKPEQPAPPAWTAPAAEELLPIGCEVPGLYVPLTPEEARVKFKDDKDYIALLDLAASPLQLDAAEVAAARLANSFEQSARWRAFNEALDAEPAPPPKRSPADLAREAKARVRPGDNIPPATAPDDGVDWPDRSRPRRPPARCCKAHAAKTRGGSPRPSDGTCGVRHCQRRAGHQQ